MLSVGFYRKHIIINFEIMGFRKFFKHVFSRKSNVYPIFAQQASFLCQASDILVRMLGSLDQDIWKSCEKEIKTCEVQGDALKTEFREQLSIHKFPSLNRSDLQAIAMSMDDSLDVIKDIANAIIIYNPKKIDSQLKDLAGLIRDEAYVLRELLPLLWDLKHQSASIVLQCDRVTELEHEADDDYEQYIGHIFADEPDFREMVKYKDLAELLEKATDTEKRVADNVRILLMRIS